MDTLVTLKLFRAIGLMGSAVLPEALITFYSKLGLITLDFEFTQPGCGGSSSAFLEIYKLNISMVVLASAPVVFILPLYMAYLRIRPTIVRVKSRIE